MLSKEKVRNQVKSKFYYIFWGIATFSVVAGQLYVGSGYRMFARSLNRIFDTIEVQVGKDYYGERFYLIVLSESKENIKFIDILHILCYSILTFLLKL